MPERASIMTKFKELNDKYVSQLKEVRAIAAKAEDEDREFTAEERSEIVRRTDELKDLKAQVKEAKGDKDLRDQIKALADEGIGAAPDNGKAGDGQPGTPGNGKTIGERFVNSPEFKGFIGQFDGRIPDSAKGLISPPVHFKDVLTGGSDTQGGAFVQTDFTGIYETLGRDMLVLRDLMSTRQTGTDTVEFVRQTTQSTAAASVAEASGSSGGDESGDVTGTKPESTMAFEKVQASVKTLAVWVPATKRALSDAAQLRGLIDDELRADLNDEVEDQLINGDGSGEDFTGIANTSDVQSQAYSSTVSGLDGLLETTLKAATKVRTVGRAVPTGYVLNPLDWEAIQLARLAKNPNNEAIAGSVPTLHGIPVVQSQKATSGVGYVGDWRKAVLWDREQTTVQVSDSHADFFIRNLVAVLAELRAAFGVIRPTAFVEIDLDAGT